MSPVFARILLYAVIIAGFIVSAIVGSAVGSGNALVIVSALIIVGSAAWMILARERWWLPMPLSLALGGVFYVPFKLYPHEIALVACGLGLVPQLLYKRQGLMKKRVAISRWLYVLTAYLLAHYAASLLANHDSSIGGNGNIARAYMNMLWPCLFMILFHLYGSTEHLGEALVLIYVGTAIRLVFGMVNHFTGEDYIVPGLNYSLDPQDLRASSPVLFMVAFLYLMKSRSFTPRFWHTVVILIALYGVLLGGSRSQIVQVPIIGMIVLLLRRKWLGLSAVAAVAIVFVAYLNVRPELLDPLPYRVQRGLSILILGSPKISVQEDVQDSDQWHSVLRLEGQKRWTGSVKTVVVGTGVKPYNPLDQDFIASSSDPIYMAAQVSADLGAYESALWTVLAILGTAGMLLYCTILLPAVPRFYRLVSRYGVVDPTTAFALWAVVWIVSWFIFSPFLGTYPSFELFLIGLTGTAVMDNEASEKATRSLRRGIVRPRYALAGWDNPVGIPRRGNRGMQAPSKFRTT